MIWWMDKENLAYTHTHTQDKTLFKHKKKGIISIYDNGDKPRGHYVKWNKLDKETNNEWSHLKTEFKNMNLWRSVLGRSRYIGMLGQRFKLSYKVNKSRELCCSTDGGEEVNSHEGSNHCTMCTYTKTVKTWKLQKFCRELWFHAWRKRQTQAQILKREFLTSGSFWTNGKEWDCGFVENSRQEPTRIWLFLKKY